MLDASNTDRAPNLATDLRMRMGEAPNGPFPGLVERIGFRSGPVIHCNPTHRSRIRNV